MVMAMQFTQAGVSDVLKSVDIHLPEPGAGQVSLRHTAIGLNYIDVYHRSGLYPVALPCIPGLEGVGVIDAIGPNVTALRPGDRVAYGRGPLGAYAERRIIGEAECVHVPDNVSDDIAASVMLKGLTAWYLLHQTFPIAKGDTILVHAAAGGVGLILSQWAKKLGALVIGTVGSSEKADLARKYGCDAVILYRQENVAQRVKSLTDNRGVDVVYDAVGKATFFASLDSLKPQGMMVSYGQASGDIPPFDLKELAKRGSLFITRPSLMDYMKSDAIYRRAANDLLRRVATADILVHPPKQFPLKDAAAAHRALEARETIGATVLIP
jgi:NADPH2:quinone reductase